MTDCLGCSTDQKKCALKQKGLSPLCICKECIVKPTCNDACKEFIIFFRNHGIMKFDKATGGAIFYIKSEEPRKSTGVKVKVAKGRKKIKRKTKVEA